MRFPPGTSAIIGVGLALTMLSGCGGVSELTEERVARTETALRQAEQTVGRSEEGALELQSAKENLAQGRQAIERGEGEEAERFAQLAQLDAELAVAKSQTAAARRAADEVLASIKALEAEAERDGSTPR